MKYGKIEEVIQIWRILLLRDSQGQQNSCKEFRLKFGYEEIIKEGVKTTDVERKERLFNLLVENVKLLWGEGCKDLILAISQSYFKIF